MCNKNNILLHFDLEFAFIFQNKLVGCCSYYTSYRKIKLLLFIQEPIDLYHDFNLCELPVNFQCQIYVPSSGINA